MFFWSEGQVNETGKAHVRFSKEYNTLPLYFEFEVAIPWWGRLNVPELFEQRIRVLILSGFFSNPEGLYCCGRFSLLIDKW